jgi:hypothetical protein
MTIEIVDFPIKHFPWLSFGEIAGIQTWLGNPFPNGAFNGKIIIYIYIY